MTSEVSSSLVSGQLVFKQRFFLDDSGKKRGERDKKREGKKERKEGNERRKRKGLRRGEEKTLLVFQMASLLRKLLPC